MSGIAEVLCNLGFAVSGSDIRKSKNTERLELIGMNIFEGHAAENVGDAQVVVYSSAVKDDNPEIMIAKQRGIPVIPRAEMLAELMTLKPYAVAISGTHGKTTTTSMVATILGHAEYAIVEHVRGTIEISLHRVPLDRDRLDRANRQSDHPLREFLLQQYSG